ncbi:MAG: gluconolaconase, partial [Waterburya sp.]
MKRRELFMVGFAGAIAFSSNDRVNASIKKLTPIELPHKFQYPNGITNASEGTLYVGSITSGKILRINPNEKIETLFPGNSDV